MTSKLYSEPLNAGRRCIVICEGFYEWKTTEGPGKKKPYFIYTPQKSEVCISIDSLFIATVKNNITIDCSLTLISFSNVWSLLSL